MTEKKLDPRGTVAVINANLNKMCNAETVEEVNECFLLVKDLVIALYQEKFKSIQ